MNRKDVTKNQQIKRMSNLSSQIDVLKASRSQRHSNYYCLRKSRVAPRTLPAIRPHALFLRERWSKSILFGHPENRKWHQNRPVDARWALGPSKNAPQWWFWKNMKNQWIFYSKMKCFRSEKSCPHHWFHNEINAFASFWKWRKNNAKRGAKS